MHARENQMDIEEWTTQRHGQHWAQDIEHEDKQNKNKRHRKLKTKATRTLSRNR